MSDDLSDEALDEVYADLRKKRKERYPNEPSHTTYLGGVEDGMEAVRRRAEAQIEAHRNQYDKDLMSLQMVNLRLKESIEQREREALTWGWSVAVGTTNYDQERRLEEAYRAWRAQREGK